MEKKEAYKVTIYTEIKAGNDSIQHGPGQD